MIGTKEEHIRRLNTRYPIWEEKTIWEHFLDACSEFPNNDFIVSDTEGSLTYRQTMTEVAKMAARLKKIGVTAGDHVALQVRNCTTQILVGLALAALRAVKVSVNAAMGPKELSYVLSQSDADYFITNQKISWLTKPEKLKSVVLMPDGECDEEIRCFRWEEFLHIAEDEEYMPPVPDGSAQEVSDIIYTSGSTSAPKGVMLTHDMLMRSALASCYNRGFEEGRRIYVPLPMFHVYGYVEGMLAAILVGGAVLVKNGKFEPAGALDFMVRSRANDILSVPSQMITIVNYLKDQPRDLKDLHAVYCSASVCPTWVWQAIRTYLKVNDVITGYGMSEVCGASMQTDPSDQNEILMTRVGKLLPGGAAGLPELGGHQTEYRVVDRETSNDCAPNEDGELWCRGPVVTKGYYNKPEVNAKSFTEDGWLKTGDCGHFDENGYLLLAGRIDDMYKINGENVSPKFIEDVFGNCELINTSAVLGVKDPLHGYVGIAFIELKEDDAANRTAVEQYADVHLAKFQRPKYYVYLRPEEWPLTSTGKIQRFRLKERAAEYEKRAELEAQKKWV